MRICDIIQKKKEGRALSRDEISFFVNGFTNGSIKDYQMSALLMAIWFNSMNDDEISALTLAMAHSGDTVDLSGVDGFTVDKHSTGGVGDKTTLITAPIVAACGGKVAKMSGRGLGHTGGTIDKLESIPGFNTSLSKEQFIKNVNSCGLCVVGQTGNLAPADKKIYALRDVTATVDSIPLIASSIMSKKLAAGSKGIVLDVKTGSGAFMKTVESATLLAEKMVSIGKSAGRKTVAVITDMSVPLGRAVGNSLEVEEAVRVLRGEQSGELLDVSVELAANMLSLVHSKSVDECRADALKSINDGSALEKFRLAVELQGGDGRIVDDLSLLPKARFKREITAAESGYFEFCDVQKVGEASSALGAGRQTKEDSIDYAAGIILNKKNGDFVDRGESVATLYTNKEESFELAESLFKLGTAVSPDPKQGNSPIIKTVS